MGATRKNGLMLAQKKTKNCITTTLNWRVCFPTSLSHNEGDCNPCVRMWYRQRPPPNKDGYLFLYRVYSLSQGGNKKYMEGTNTQPTMNEESTLVIIYKKMSGSTTSTQYVGDVSLKEKFNKQILADALMELTRN